MEEWTQPTNGTGKCKRRSSILKSHRSPENDTEHEIVQERCTTFRDTRRVSFAEVAAVKEFSVTTSSNENESAVPSGILSSLDGDLRGLLTGEIQNDCQSHAILSGIENKNDQSYPAQVPHSKRAPLQPIAVLPEDYTAMADKENVGSAIIVDTRYEAHREETCVFDEGEDMALTTSCYIPISSGDEIRGMTGPEKTRIFLEENNDMEMTNMCTANINICPDFSKTVVFQGANMDMEMTGQVAIPLADPDTARNRLMDKFKAMAAVSQFPANETSITKPNASNPTAENTSINTYPESTRVPMLAVTSSSPPTQVDEAEPAINTEVLPSQEGRSIDEAVIQQTDGHPLKDTTAILVHPIPHIECPQESPEVNITKNENLNIPVGELSMNCLKPHEEITDSVKCSSSLEDVANDGSIIDPSRSDLGAVCKKRKAFGPRNSLLSKLHVSKKLLSLIVSVDENTTKAESFSRSISKSPAVQMKPPNENESLAATPVNVIPVIPEVILPTNKDVEATPQLDTSPVMCTQTLVSPDKEVLALQRSEKEQKYIGKEESFMDEELIMDLKMDLVEDYPSVFSSPGNEKLVPIRSHDESGNASIESSIKPNVDDLLEIPDAGPDEEMCKESEADKPSLRDSDEDEAIDHMEISNMLDKFDEVEKLVESLMKAEPSFDELDKVEQTEIEIAEATATYDKKLAELKKSMEQRDEIYARKRSLENDVEERKKEIKLQKFMPRLNEFTPEEFTSDKFLASYMWNTFRTCVTFSHKEGKNQLVCSLTLIPNPEGLTKAGPLCKLVCNSVWENIQQIKDKPSSWMCLTELQCTSVLSEISMVVSRARILIDDILNFWCSEEITIQERTVSVEFLSSKKLVIFSLIFTILPDRLGDYMPVTMKVLTGHIEDEIIFKCIADVEEGPMYFRRVVKRVSDFLRS